MTHFVILFGMREENACSELSVSPVVAVLMQNQNQDIWNCHGSLTLNKGKLTLYFRGFCHVIVSNMTHFFILFLVREKHACFELLFSPVVAVLMQNQNQDIWNCHCSLTLNKRKLTGYFRGFCHVIVSNMTHFFILFDVREKHAGFELPVSPVVAVLMQNQNEDIWNFHGSLTFNKGKVTGFFGVFCHVIESNMTNFVILFGVRGKHACFELPVSPAVAVLTHNQNEDIWKFHGSLTLNKGN